MKFQFKKYRKRLLIYSLLAILVVALITALANWKIEKDTKDFVFDDVNDVPAQRVALVLGTAKNIGNRPNIYFTNRIKAAADLYKAGKVEKFLVSGDNSRKEYNEPEDMRNALVEAGVPDSIIHFDYAGLRTLDSVVRANKIFGQDAFIIVSQKFHNQRAIFLAQYYGYEVYGYNAVDLSINRSSFKTKVRELFARVKVFIDIIVGKEPKFLGETIDIE